MKNKIITILLSLCLLSSCSDDFLDRNSLVGLSDGGFWTTQENAILGINPLYHANREFTNSIVTQGMLDDFSDISYHSLNTGLTTGSYPTNASFFLNSWGIFYKGIYRANTALKYVPDIAMDAQIKDRCLGEAKFFRGYFYFKLWDYFGGVPIYDFPMDPSEAYKPRNTEREVYEFIVQDMTDAYALLPGKYEGPNVGRATKWAALAMRGKAHLWAKEYAKAAADFKELMEKSDRKLLDDYHTLFRVAGNNNSEVIFDVQYIEETGHGVQTDRAYGSSTSSLAISASQYTRPTNELVNSYEMIDGSPFDFSNFTNKNGDPFDPNVAENWHDEASVKKLFENRDPRLQQSILVPWSTIVGKGDVTYTYRFPITSAADSYQIVWQNGSYGWRKFVETGTKYTLRMYAPQNYPLIRLADVMLMYAEAQNEALASPDQSVYDAVNDVRDRAGMPDLPTGLNKDQMRERIRHERKVELCGEGMRYSDIRRWKIAKGLLDGVWMREFTGAEGRHLRGFPDHFYLWAIPQQEITLNPTLEQNPGWD
ncbi:MAG: RagB/SusD family nutrient uptake outer membrane protein [Dysgonomonas sp.]|nr:RagB/SusD family nutrient uptake outer membrane protein [Dysgonomonas sp.]